jgi:dolichol kinase
MKITNKRKHHIFRVLNLLTFGFLSQWFITEFEIEYLSFTYAIFAFLVLLISLFSSFQEKFKMIDEKEDEELLNLFDKAKETHKKKKGVV